MAWKLKKRVDDKAPKELGDDCIMCIAVDPDTGEIKDFASDEVTAGLTVGAGITIGEQLWNGQLRKHFKLTGSDSVAFGATKPQFTLNAANPQTTVVWIGKFAGAFARMFGNGSSDYFCSSSLSAGGATYPHAVISGIHLTGGNPAPVAGSKGIFGHSITRSGPVVAYKATDTDSAMTATALTLGAYNASYPISYIGRRADSASQQADEVNALIIFNKARTADEWNSLRADWLNVMLVQVAAEDTDAEAPSATLTGAASLSPGSATSGVAGIDAAAPGASLTGTATLTPGAAVATASGTFTSTPMINNTGSPMANTSVVWEWRQGVGIGTPSISVVYGPGKTSAASTLTVSGLPLGAGELLVATPDYSQVFYERGTVA